MPEWLLFSNMDGSFSLYEDPLGDARENASLGILTVICLITLLFPVFSNPNAFAPALICFLLALVIRFFFCRGTILSIFCPVFLPFAAYSFVQFSLALIVNEKGEMVLIAWPVIILTAIMYALFINNLTEDPDSEFNMAMILLFSLPLGIASPLYGMGIGNGVVILYTLRALYILTAILIIRNIVLFFKAVSKGQIHPGSIIKNLLMLAGGVGIYLLICLSGAIAGKLSWIICIILIAVLTLLYPKLFNKASAASVSLRLLLLPMILILLLYCFGGSVLTFKDDFVYPFADTLGQFSLLSRIASFSSNTTESFASLFTELIRLPLCLIEKTFHCSIRKPQLSSFTGMILCCICLSVTMLLTRVWMDRAKRRREWKSKHRKQ